MVVGIHIELEKKKRTPEIVISIFASSENKMADKKEIDRLNALLANPKSLLCQRIYTTIHDEKVKEYNDKSKALKFHNDLKKNINEAIKK